MRTQSLVGRRRLFQLLNQLAQARLLGFRDDEKFHADALGSAPTHRGIFDFQGSCLSGKVQQERYLHSREGRDQTFDATPLRRKIADGALMTKLIPLNDGARHAHDKSTMLASDHWNVLFVVGLRSSGCQSL
jgi:hypothetical protein